MTQTITEWMVTVGLASNGFAAGHMVEGLRLNDGCDRDTQERRCRLYRTWRNITRREITPKHCYDLAIAEIDPADVAPRQIEMELEDGTDEIPVPEQQAIPQ